MRDDKNSDAVNKAERNSYPHLISKPRPEFRTLQVVIPFGYWIWAGVLKLEIYAKRTNCNRPFKEARTEKRETVLANRFSRFCSLSSSPFSSSSSLSCLWPRTNCAYASSCVCWSVPFCSGQGSSLQSLRNGSKLHMSSFINCYYDYTASPHCYTICAVKNGVIFALWNFITLNLQYHKK